MNILITGASGFLGKRLVSQLAERPDYVLLGLDRNPNYHQQDLAAFYRGDLTGDVLDQINEPVDVVVHTAADVDQCLNERCVVDNLYALHLLGEWSRAHGVGRIIYPSTTGICGDQGSAVVTEGSKEAPRSLYTVTKYLAEQYLRTCGIDSLILRFSYLFGAGDTKGTLAEVIRAVIEGTAPRIREESRDYLNGGDAVRAVEMALDYQGPRRHFNCGTGHLTSMRNLILLIGKLAGVSVRDPLLKGVRQNAAVDSSLARRELGWVPSQTLEQGLAEQIEFLRK
jgi:UDP-glucose 4-epimerase